jgi:ligand-binding sensor domain-containing protein
LKSTTYLNRLFVKFFLVLICLLIPTQVSAQYVRKETFNTERQRRARYALSDWISYLSYRQITSMVIGYDYVYIGTRDGGILRYKYYEDGWDYPFTTSNGLPDNHILNLAFDREASILWAVTPIDTAIFLPTEEVWLSQSEAEFWNYTFPKMKENLQNPDGTPINRLQNRESLIQLPTFFANGEYTIIDNWILMDEYLREFPIKGYFQDRKDRIWFAVEDFGIGLGDFFIKRADFYQFGLSAVSPRVIAFAGRDLWIGGIKLNYGRAGIANWPSENLSWKYYEARWISRLPNDNVRDILILGDSLWFATDYGVSVYSPRKDKWKNFSLRQGLISTTILDLEILANYIYVATEQGYSKIDLYTNQVKRITDKRFFNLPVNRFAVQNDTLWAATNRGIFRLISTSDKWEFVSSQAAIQDLRITAIEYYDGEMWFASEGGIMKLEINSNKWESFPPLAFEISPPYLDIKVNDESVWVTTGEGLLKFDRKRNFWRLFTVQDGLLDNHCYRVLIDGDYLWVTTKIGVTRFFWNNPERFD